MVLCAAGIRNEKIIANKLCITRGTAPQGGPIRPINPIKATGWCRVSARVNPPWGMGNSSVNMGAMAICGRGRPGAAALGPQCARAAPEWPPAPECAGLGRGSPR